MDIVFPISWGAATRGGSRLNWTQPNCSRPQGQAEPNIPWGTAQLSRLIKPTDRDITWLENLTICQKKPGQTSSSTAMAEALAALGLAANVVQFIDFVSNLISSSSEVVSSAQGSTERDRELEQSLHGTNWLQLCPYPATH